jgi:hypothetical protein
MAVQYCELSESDIHQRTRGQQIQPVAVAANSGGRSASAAGLLIAANSAQVDHPLETGNGRCSHGPAWTTACLVLAPGPV